MLHPSNYKCHIELRLEPTRTTVTSAHNRDAPNAASATDAVFADGGLPDAVATDGGDESACTA